MLPNRPNVPGDPVPIGDAGQSDQRVTRARRCATLGQVSQALNVSDQLASVASALIGLLTLLLARHRFHDSRQREAVGQELGITPLPSADAPLFLGLTRSRIAVQLGSVWLLAVALTLYGHAIDSYLTFLAGLVLMGVVIVASSLIAPPSEPRPTDAAASGPAGQDGSKRHLLVADATAVVLLAAVGYLLALAAYQRHIPVTWLVPGFAGASAVLGLARTRRGVLASPRMVARSTGALTLGAIAALVVLFLSYGPETGWSTNRKLQSGHATGTVRQIAEDEVQVFGSVVDDAKDRKSVRLYLFAQPINGAEYSVPYTAIGGATDVETIDQDQDPSTQGHTFPGVTSVRGKLCRNDYNEPTFEFPEPACTEPFPIWPG